MSTPCIGPDCRRPEHATTSEPAEHCPNCDGSHIPQTMVSGGVELKLLACPELDEGEYVILQGGLPEKPLACWSCRGLFAANLEKCPFCGSVAIQEVRR